jgi:hypothetical protein
LADGAGCLLAFPGGRRPQGRTPATFVSSSGRVYYCSFLKPQKMGHLTNAILATRPIGGRLLEGYVVFALR